MNDSGDQEVEQKLSTLKCVLSETILLEATNFSAALIFYTPCTKCSALNNFPYMEITNDKNLHIFRNFCYESI